MTANSYDDEEWEAIGDIAAYVSKPVVVGVYGVCGCGKSHLLEKLKQTLPKGEFDFHDGSTIIDSVVPGGLKAFRAMVKQQQNEWRQIAIQGIGDECARSTKTGVVAGHYMFWPEEEESPEVVWTTGDGNTFTHILYLEVDAKDIAQRRSGDICRKRDDVSTDHLREWQQAEKDRLRAACRDQGILFSVISADQDVPLLLSDFRQQGTWYNQSKADVAMVAALLKAKKTTSLQELETVLVLDADRTLAAADTGSLFWKKFFDARPTHAKEDPLKAVFSSDMGYSYTAFRQVALLYEEVADQEFETLCQDVASEVVVYPEFVNLLQEVAKHPHVAAVVVTSGLCRIWEKALENHGLFNKVKVVGKGRIRDKLPTVTPRVKEQLVTHLQRELGVRVWAFGDSPVDLDMLVQADHAIVVVGERDKRSTSMEAALTNTIAQRGLRAHQVLLPGNVSPRIDTVKLPPIQFTQEFLDDIFVRRALRGPAHIHHAKGVKAVKASKTSKRGASDAQVIHATESNATKVLMTATRNKSMAGPALREAHRKIGWYLAIEFLTEVIGVETYGIPHVQGNETDGHRIRHEKQTTIVALMRGGEPMAFGVSDALPLAMFVHAKNAENLKIEHLKGQQTVVLVDSVVNEGRSVMEFFDHIRGLNAEIRIVVISGVTQHQAIRSGKLAQSLASDSNFILISLRVSGNKYKGKGGTDTGHRLFNTTAFD